MGEREDSAPDVEKLRREKEALQREVDKLRAELAAAGRSASRRDEAQAAERLGQAGRLAASEARMAAAEIDMQEAWARAGQLGALLGRRIAEGQARLIASQAAVASLERANGGLAAGQAAIALREADLRAIIESAIDCAIVTTDRDGLVLAWNCGARQLLGWDEARAAATSLDAVLPVEERDALAADARVALSGQRVTREGRLVRQDGVAIWAGIEATALRVDGVEEPVGVLWMLRDRSAARQAEAALRESEIRHRLLIDSWAQAVWETDADGAIVTDSPSWRAYTGQTLDEWLGYGWLNAIHPDDRAHAGRQWREAVAAQGLVDAEFRLRAPDSGWRWTNVRAAPVIDASGRTEKWVGMNINIDARKAAEAALREAETRYRTLFEAMDEAFAVVEVLRDEAGAWRDFRFVEVNAPFVRHTAMPWPVGRTATELLGTPSPRWAILCGRALDTGEPLRVQEAEPTLGRIFDLNIFALDRDRGRVAVLFTDVTARVRAEAALSESEARFRTLADAAPALIWRNDAEGRNLYLNAYSVDFTGMTAEEIAGEGWHKLVHPEEAAAYIAGYLDAARQRRAWHARNRLRRHDGAWRWFDNYAQPLFGTDGMYLGHVGVSIDVTAAVEAEAARRESEEQRRIALQSNGMGAWRWDTRKRSVRADEVVQRLWGVSVPEQPHQVSVYADLMFSDGAAWLEAATTRAIAPGEEFEAQMQVARGPTAGRWVQLRGRAEQDKPWIVNGVSFDITAQRQAEQRLRESEARFRGFAENSANVLWMANADGTRLEYLSPAFERTFGEAPDRIMADIGRLLELVHPEDREAMAGFMLRAVKGETAIAHYRVIRPVDGRVVHLRDTGFPIRGAQGEVFRVAGITQDVSDLHEAAVARETEKERFRTLAEGIPQLVWRSAAQGRWTWASPQWRDYTGLSSDDSQDTGWLRALHPADHEAARMAWEEADAMGLYQADFRLRHAGTGRYAWFQTRALPFRNPDGRVVEWIGACTNIDNEIRARETLERSAEELERRVDERTGELMAAEASLRQSQKLEAIGQLTGGIAHDFNNMLQGVGGALAMAQRRLAEGRATDVTRYLQVAGDASARAAGLTRRLLAFARRQRLDPRPVDPDALVGGMADLLRRTMGPAIEVEFRLRDGAFTVLCDPSELEGAVLNLCINARDAMPTGGRLAISTTDLHLTEAEIAPHEGAAPGDYVSIGIEDTGTGMTPEVLEHVLEPFFTTKPQGEGTGLGLSQVHSFVRQSGGALRIASAVGQGTAIQILLPRSAAQAEAEGPEAAPVPPTKRGETVLMVDDETAVRGPAAERLRDLGYRVVEANDGPTALRLLDEGLRPDVLVTDVGLPNGMDGRVVTEEARRRLPDLPVIFVMGYARVALPEDAVIVTKPFDLEVLARRLEGLRQTIHNN